MRNDERPAFDPANNTLTTSPTITWDRRDSPVHPTRGFMLLGQLELVFSEFDGQEGLPVKATLTSQYVHSFFKRQLIVVPNLRIGSVWTSPTTSEPKSGFFFKAGGDGVSYPIRGYTTLGSKLVKVKKPSYGGMCDTVFPGCDRSRRSGGPRACRWSCHDSRQSRNAVSHICDG